MSKEQQAISAVKASTPGGSKFKVTGEVSSILNGTLLTVEFEHDQDVWNEKYVLFIGNEIEVIPNSHTLATLFAQKTPQNGVERVVRLLSDPNVASAAIAFLILAIIIYRTLKNLTPVPELTNAFTLILGFYFGSKSRKI